MRRVLAGGGILLVGVLSACGGGTTQPQPGGSASASAGASSGASAGASEGTSAHPSASASASASGGGLGGSPGSTDAAWAKGVALQVGDLPGGWKLKSDTVDPSEAALSKELDQCLGVVAIDSIASSHESYTFARSDGLAEVSEDMFTLQSPAQVQTNESVLASEKGVACEKQVSEAHLAEFKSATGIDVAKIPVVGGAAYAFRLSVHYSSAGKAYDVVSDDYGFSAGRGEVDVVFTQGATPLSQAFEKPVVEKAMSRAGV